MRGYCQFIQHSSIGTQIRESIVFYPVIEGLHVLGLAFSVGLVLWFDLRLLGIVLTERRASVVYRRIFPWMISGYTLMTMTGIVLFWSEAAKAYDNAFGRLKFLALILAGLNILIYHMKFKRDIEEWDSLPRAPGVVRVIACLSIFLWFAIIAFGRLMAYIHVE